MSLTCQGYYDEMVPPYMEQDGSVIESQDQPPVEIPQRHRKQQWYRSTWFMLLVLIVVVILLVAGYKKYSGHGAGNDSDWRHISVRTDSLNLDKNMLSTMK
jgi:hypothetical protein